MATHNCLAPLEMQTLQTDRRENQRFTLRPDVSRVVVQCDDIPLEGHPYDLSSTGIRLELDEVLPIGKKVQVQLFFAGILSAICFTGLVTRLFDEIDDPGPRRMGIEIQKFASKQDETRLNDLLYGGSLGKLR